MTGKQNGVRYPAKLTVEQVKSIKLRIQKGEPLRVLAAEHSMTYMNLYRMATGETWKDIEPTGRLIPLRTQGRLTSDLRDWLFEQKRKTEASNAELAASVGLSETSVRRGLADARALLAARVQRLLTTSGDHRAACKQFGLTEEQAEELVSYANEHELPRRLRFEAERL